MQTNIKLLEFLQTNLGSSKLYSGDEYYFKCPLCIKKDGKRKLAINLSVEDKDTFQHWHCWRDDSHRGSNLLSLFKKMKVNDSKINELKSILKSYGITYDINNLESELFKKQEVSKIVDIELPKEFKSFTDCESTNPEFRNALSYILKRGITKDDIIKNNIGYCDSGKYKNCIIVPSYDENIRVNYFIARQYYEGGMRYNNPPASKNIVFNELHIAWTFPIVLCEGVFDALAIKRNAIPLLGKTIGDTLKRKMIEKHVKDVYLCLDKDAMKNSILYIEDFMKNGINVYFVNLPEGKENEKYDPGKLGFKKMVELIKLAKKVEFSDLIKFKLSL